MVTFRFFNYLRFNSVVDMGIIKTLYQWKIKTMFYFNQGYQEVAILISVVKDIGIILTVLDFLFHVHWDWRIDALICLVAFGCFTFLGWILKETGMSDFNTKMSNSINPEIKMILENTKELLEKL